MTAYKVIVSGTVFEVSKDVLIAERIAYYYKEIGWKNVKVKKYSTKKEGA
jgi:hypothetical protein